MYLLLTIKAKKELSDLIELKLYELAKSGWEYEEKDGFIIYKFYFPLKLEEEATNLLKQFYEWKTEIDLDLSLDLLPKERWEEIWKYNFPPLRVGKKILILPPWEADTEEEGRVKIIIYPGQAFGTGHHATTQLMLQNLEEFLLDHSDSPLEIIDLGCGTGILAIASAKLCPKAKVWAVDIDDLALESAKKNLKLNNLSEGQVIVTKALPQEEHKFDLLLANIGFEELKKLAPMVRKLLKIKKGHAFLSGFFTEKSGELLEFYRPLNFKLVKKQSLKEWDFLHLVV